MSTGIRLGGPDQGTIDYLHTWPHGLYVHTDVDNDDPSIHEFLIERLFGNGWLLIEPERSTIIDEFRAMTLDPLRSEPDATIVHVIDYYRHRARNFSHVESVAQIEDRRGRIPAADHLTPTNCIGHAGRTFEIAEAADRIYWLRQLSSEKYRKLAYGVDFGFPPFNCLCTCMFNLIIEGVPESEPVHRRRRPSPWERLEYINNILSKSGAADMSQNKFDQLLELMCMVAVQLAANPHPQSLLERRIGEILIERGQTYAAIAHFEKALRINPRVGIKKRLEELRGLCDAPQSLMLQVSVDARTGESV